MAKTGTSTSSGPSSSSISVQPEHDPLGAVARPAAPPRRRTPPATRRARRRGPARRRSPRARARGRRLGGTSTSTPWVASRSRRNGCSMVNLVPSSATRESPAPRTAAAVTSAMWISGTPVAASIASATLCIVLVQSTTHSAPAASSGGGLGGEQAAGVLPVPRGLHGLDLGEVDGGHQHAGRVEAAEAVAHRLVEDLVVERGALPAHPAQQADLAHRRCTSVHAPIQPAGSTVTAWPAAPGELRRVRRPPRDARPLRRRPHDGRPEEPDVQRLLVPEPPHPGEGQPRAGRARPRGLRRGADAQAHQAGRARLRRRRGRRVGGRRPARGAALRPVHQDPARRRPARLVGVVHPGPPRPPGSRHLPRAARRRGGVRRRARRPGRRGLPGGQRGPRRST